MIRLSKNQGQPAATNKGILEAKYEFLTFLDADDLWTKDKLLLQQTFFQKNPDCDLLFGMMQAFMCPSVDEKTKARLQYKKGIHPGYSICTMMIKKEKMTLLKGFNETLLAGSFIDLYAQAEHLKLKIDLHPELFVKRRIRPNTLSRRVQGEKNDFAKNFLQLVRNQIIRKRESV